VELPERRSGQVGLICRHAVDFSSNGAHDLAGKAVHALLHALLFLAQAGIEAGQAHRWQRHLMLVAHGCFLLKVAGLLKGLNQRVKTLTVTTPSS